MAKARAAAVTESDFRNVIKTPTILLDPASHCGGPDTVENGLYLFTTGDRDLYGPMNSPFPIWPLCCKKTIYKGPL